MVVAVLEMKMAQKLCPPIVEGERKVDIVHDYNHSIWDSVRFWIVKNMNKELITIDICNLNRGN